MLPLEKVADLSTYDAIILGAPMILGWHRSAVAFLKKRRKALENIPLAIFATAMSLTATTEKAVKSVPLCIDPKLAKPPQNPEHLTFHENYARITRYTSPMLNAAGINKPVSRSTLLAGKILARFTSVCSSSWWSSKSVPCSR